MKRNKQTKTKQKQNKAKQTASDKQLKQKTVSLNLSEKPKYLKNLIMEHKNSK